MNSNDRPSPENDPPFIIRPNEPDIEIITPSQPYVRSPQPPLHLLSSIVTIALDWVWFLVELPATVSLAFLPTLLPLSMLLGLVTFGAVTLVQHFLADETWGRAVAKGVVMGIVAGVPYPVFGTVVGAPLAAWAGVHEIQKLLPGRRD
jgi:hypothetical protein